MAFGGRSYGGTHSLGQAILFGFQHVLTMFPATVLCALIVGFHVSTGLTITGLATIAALAGSRLGIGKFIPLYYGSSFSYLAATVAITNASFAQPAPDELIQIAQAGIVITGLINVVVGLIIRFAGGKETIDKILPPIVAGSVACLIGIGLGAAAQTYLIHDISLLSGSAKRSAQITPSPRSFSISASVYPNPAKTSSLCWPRVGGGRR